MVLALLIVELFDCEIVVEKRLITIKKFYNQRSDSIILF